MKRLIAPTVLSSTLLLSVIISLTLAVSRPVAHRVSPALPTQFAIGSSHWATLGWHCANEYPVDGYRYCMYGDVYEIILTYDRVQRVYIFTPMNATPITIGDLINEWGDPIGARYGTANIFVYWVDKWAALRTTPHPSPSSTVFFVAYGVPPSLKALTGWRGLHIVNEDR